MLFPGSLDTPDSKVVRYFYLQTKKFLNYFKRSKTFSAQISLAHNSAQAYMTMGSGIRGPHGERGVAFHHCKLPTVITRRSHVNHTLCRQEVKKWTGS